MENKIDPKLMAEAMRLYHSPEGQALIRAFQGPNKSAAEKAMAQLQRGDVAGAKGTLSALLTDSQVKALEGKLYG